MNESIRDILTREAQEAELTAEAQERGDLPPAPGQRARRQPSDPAQVYSVRIPVDRLEQLRHLAERRGARPSALLRQFVLERLDAETAPRRFTAMADRDPGELRLGPSRQAAMADVDPLSVKRQA